MSLVDHVIGLVESSGGGDAAAVTTFYVGLAIARRDPAVATRLLGQLDREMGDATGLQAEQIEVVMRTASRTIAEFLDHTVEEP